MSPEVNSQRADSNNGTPLVNTFAEIPLEPVSTEPVSIDIPDCPQTLSPAESQPTRFFKTARRCAFLTMRFLSSIFTSSMESIRKWDATTVLVYCTASIFVAWDVRSTVAVLFHISQHSSTMVVFVFIKTGLSLLISLGQLSPIEPRDNSYLFEMSIIKLVWVFFITSAFFTVIAYFGISVLSFDMNPYTAAKIAQNTSLAGL